MLRPRIVRSEPRKVDKPSTIRVASARCSVPHRLVGHQVEAVTFDGRDGHLCDLRLQLPRRQLLRRRRLLDGAPPDARTRQRDPRDSIPTRSERPEQLGVALDQTAPRMVHADEFAEPPRTSIQGIRTCVGRRAAPPTCRSSVGFRATNDRGSPATRSATSACSPRAPLPSAGYRGDLATATDPAIIEDT
jgi:hypothetical protein